ncbi:MAG: YbjN domain-containing protein [Thermoleophilia bacterium]|nr:YbjN domain-containing protein [Thermoleophilia bacterium]
MELTDRIQGILADAGLEPDRVDARTVHVALPSQARGGIGVLIRGNERTASLTAFVMRRPDRHAEAVQFRLLRRNLDTPWWRFAVDDHGDVFAVAHADARTLEDDGLDALLGLLVATVDEVYEPLVRTGFDIPDGVSLSPPTVE